MHDPLSPEARTLSSRVRQQELLLAEHLSLLESRAEEILHAPALRSIRLLCAHVYVLYIGHSSPSLGTLLEGWAHGKLTTPAPGSGEALRILSLSGSPLSGNHQLTALCPGGGVSDVKRLPRSTLATHALPFFSKKEPTEAPPWSLSQLLASWGIPIEPVLISSEQGTPVARYDFQSSTLEDASGAVLAHLDFHSPGDFQGTWIRPHQLQLSTAQGKHLCIRGVLTSPEQLTAPSLLPPLVLWWLASHPLTEG